MIGPLILSVFPGIDLLGRAFEEVWPEACIVRGPDLLWGGDIRSFHPPAGKFNGVIGGPPCQAFSALAHLVRHNGHEPRFGNLIPEFERVVDEAAPSWFLMENVPAAPIPNVPGYVTLDRLVRDHHVGGVQPRARRFSFGTRDGRMLPIEWAIMIPEDGSELTTIACDSGIAYEQKRKSILGEGRTVPVKIGGSGKVKRSITGDARIASSGDRLHSKERGGGVLPGTGTCLPIEDACEAQGLPRDFTAEMPFTVQGKRRAIGNGVPLAMGRAVAKAIRRAMERPPP